MSGKEKYIELLTDSIPYIRDRFEVKSMLMFGSVARGDEHAESDVDLFVDMPPKAFQVIRLKQYLQKLLGRTVDVVRQHSRLDPFLTNEIKRDGITIFAD